MGFFRILNWLDVDFIIVLKNEYFYKIKDFIYMKFEIISNLKKCINKFRINKWLK